MIDSQRIKQLSSVLLFIALMAFLYYTIKAAQIVSNTHTGTSSGTYVSYVSTSQEIQDLAQTLTKECESTLCKAQKLLDYSSNIPYKTHTFQRNLPQVTIEQNYGDCDDKSNLLISMLHAVEMEAYFVLVPKHIFVMVPLNESSVSHKKGLWINGRKYYILESTSKGSKVGYPLKYDLDEIDVILEPFMNKKLEIKTIEYKV
jgi:hypothetical protein